MRDVLPAAGRWLAAHYGWLVLAGLPLAVACGLSRRLPSPQATTLAGTSFRTSPTHTW